jgi:broad specificity phosphatase PhoE
MGKIFIVRHGQDEDNVRRILNGRRDMPLTQLGREQARIVSNKLKNYDITVIYSSPLKRAFDTARIIADTLGISKLVTSDDLIERDFGVLTGKHKDEIPKYATKIFHTDHIDFFLDTEGAEDYPSTYLRAQKVLKDMQKKHSNENVLIVSHGDIGQMIQAAYHGWTWEKGLSISYFDNTGILELTPEKDILE